MADTSTAPELSVRLPVDARFCPLCNEELPVEDPSPASPAVLSAEIRDLNQKLEHIDHLIKEQGRLLAATRAKAYAPHGWGAIIHSTLPLNECAASAVVWIN